MKKLINVAIFLLIAIPLIVLSVVFIKPKTEYAIMYNDKIYVSYNQETFSNGNDIISFKKQDNSLTVETIDGRCVYNKDTNKVIFGVDGMIFDITYDGSSYSFSSTTTKEQIQIAIKYINIFPEHFTVINKDKMNSSVKVVLNIIFSLIIAFILSFLIYPKYFYKLCNNNKILLISSIYGTILLCALTLVYLLMMFRI